MSGRYLSDRYPSTMRAQHSVTNYHEREYSIRRSSPYFRHDSQVSSRPDQPHFIELETNWNPDESTYSLAKYPRERWHDNDHRIRERSFSPRGRKHSSLRRSEEPDLRDYLISSRKYDQRLPSDFGREGPNHDRNSSSYQMISQTSDRKYDLRLDINSRKEQESLDLWNRALQSRKDNRDDGYSRDPDRDRHFSDFRGTSYDPHRGRCSSDYRDGVYSSEPRREKHFDYKDEVYPTDYRRDDRPYNSREETYLPDSRRDWPSPDRRCQESTDSSKWRYYNQQRRELTPPGHWQNTDERRLNYLSDCQRDSRYFGQRYQDSLTKPRNDQYPVKDYEWTQGRVPFSDDLALNELNHHEGRELDYLIREERYRGHPDRNEESALNKGRELDYLIREERHGGHPDRNEESALNKAIFEPDNRRLTSLSAVNDSVPPSEIQNNPFAPVVSKPAIKEEEPAQPKLSILVQYLYNPSQPLSDIHIEHVKNMILNLTEDQKNRKPGVRWQPTFLDYIPRPNGLAIVCGNRRSFAWLRNRPIRGLKGVLFAVSDAATPIKKVRLCFQIPNCSDTPNEVLLKLQKFNRRSSIKFNLFRVLNTKYRNGDLSMVVLSDSWTAGRLKRKLNWRPRYGTHRIRINLMGKKKRSAASQREIKEKNILLDDLEEYGEMDEFSDSYDEL